MFENYFYHGNDLLSVLKSPHVPRVGEHICTQNALYQITDVAYNLNRNLQGTICVVITLKKI